jgi:hypothetical protein
MNSTVRSVIELLSLVEHYQPETMFRGHGNASWPLVPSLARFAPYVADGYDDIAGLESHLLEKFCQYSIPFRDLRSLSYIEQLVHCQHFGLPTRLLDWSTNPLKALFFAVEDPQLDHVDGCVHITEPTGWWEGTKHIKSVESLSAFFPELLHDRVAAQDACFIAFPFPKSGVAIREMTVPNYPGDLEFLFQAVVPKDQKRELRRQLANLGVTHQTVYPGLDGVAKWVKSRLSNFVV